MDGGASKDTTAAAGSESGKPGPEPLPEAEEEQEEEVNDEHIDVTSKKRMLQQMADLKSYEAHDKAGDLIMTDPRPGGDVEGANGVDVSAVLLDMLRERVSKFPQDGYDVSPVLAFGFTEDELLTQFLRWSQKDEDDVRAHRFNVDKAARRLAEFGKFFVENRQHFRPALGPLLPEASMEIMKLIGLRGDPHALSRDGYGRAVMVFDMGSSGILQAEAQKRVLTMKGNGTIETTFIRAYTWFILTVMKQPCASRNGLAFMANYGFMSVSDARQMQRLFSGKLQKTLQKLFHGTTPVKIKAMVLLNCPWWIRMMMAFARLFVSAKLMTRMHVLGDKHEKLALYFGGAAHIPQEYFGVAKK